MAEAVTSGAETNTTLTFRDFPEYDVAMAIWRYISPCLILTGTLGSILSVFVLTRKKLRSVTTMFYLVLLACTDIIVLNTGLLRYWLLYSFGYGMRISSTFSCKFHTVMVYLSLDYSSWIMVMLSVDRCISVCLPFQASRICSLRNARIISAVAFILLFAINMHYLWTYDLVEKTIFGMGTECYVAKPVYQEFVEDIWPWIDFSVVCCIPFTIMIVCNVLIVRQLIKSSNKLRSHKISTASSVVVINNQISLKTDQQQNNRNIFVRAQVTVMPKIESMVNIDTEFKKIDTGSKNNIESNEMDIKWKGNVQNKSKEEFPMSSIEKSNSVFKKHLESKNMIRVGSEGNVNIGTLEETGQGIKEKMNNDLVKNTRTEPKKNIGTIDPETKNNVENDSAKNLGSEFTGNIKRSRHISESSAPGLKKDHSRLTAMQLSINCVFLVLMLPITVYIIGYGTWKVSPEPSEEAVLMLFWAIVNMLQYTNNAIHFFLIYMTVPSFRRLFLSSCRRRRTINPENSVSLTAYK